MTYRDTDVTKLKTECKSLQESVDHLSEENTRLQEERNEARFKLRKNKINTIIQYIIVLVIVVLLSITLYLSVLLAVSFIEAGNSGQDEDSSTEENTQPQINVNRVVFGESVSIFSIPIYTRASYSTLVYYEFTQSTHSFVEFETLLTYNTINEDAIYLPILEVYRFGNQNPMVSTQISTNPMAVYLPEGRYRYRIVRRNIQTNIPMSAEVTLWNLQREEVPEDDTSR